MSERTMIRVAMLIVIVCAVIDIANHASTSRDAATNSMMLHPVMWDRR